MQMMQTRLGSVVSRSSDGTGISRYKLPRFRGRYRDGCLELGVSLVVQCRNYAMPALSYVGILLQGKIST